MKIGDLLRLGTESDASRLDDRLNRESRSRSSSTVVASSGRQAVVIGDRYGLRITENHRKCERGTALDGEKPRAMVQLLIFASSPPHRRRHRRDRGTAFAERAATCTRPPPASVGSQQGLPLQTRAPQKVVAAEPPHRMDAVPQGYSSSAGHPSPAGAVVCPEEEGRASPERDERAFVDRDLLASTRRRSQRSSSRVEGTRLLIGDATPGSMSNARRPPDPGGRHR